MTRFNLAAYVLNVYGPDSEGAEEDSAYRLSQWDKRVLANLPAVIETAEEDLSDLLPEGYEVKITPWAGN